MKYFIRRQSFKLIILFLAVSGCIEEFVPQSKGDQNLLVVEGLITDKPGNNTIRISSSMPLGQRAAAQPVTGCNVNVSDDLGNNFHFPETGPGIYTPDFSFHGVAGRSYTLNIKTNPERNNYTYTSLPALMQPVPGIDSLYFEKLVLGRSSDGWPTQEGCEIYLNTHDPVNNCKYYRWEFVETWEIRIPYYVTNNRCWVTRNSESINIKNTVALSDNRIEKLPVNFIDNSSDRLKLKYSILVNQYSISEDEFTYWDKIQTIVEQVGSLYDIIPSATFSNIKCNEKPDENVLGFFSVSAVKSRRIMIKDQFRGMPNRYRDCENASVGYNDPIPGLNVTSWVIIDHPEPPPGFKTLTFSKGCYDCRVDGSDVMPDYWDSF